MKDEEYVYRNDVRDKSITARSARSKRTHTGKGGRVRFPSDNLTRKEIEAMNGEAKSYRLNEPMSWQEFKAMPDDIKVIYVKALRKKYEVPDSKMAEMFGTTKDGISLMFKKLGLNNGKTRKRKNWDREGWLAFVNGVPGSATEYEEEVKPEQIPVLPATPKTNQEDVELSFEEADDPVDSPELCKLDYEAEFHKMCELNEVLTCKLDCIKADYKAMQTEFERMRAQLDIVYLIFGRR